MKPQLDYAEQEGKKVTFWLTDGTYRNATEDELIDFIETNGLNMDKVWWYNDSPKHDSDVRYDHFKEIFKSPEEILDNEWESVTGLYFKDKFRL